MPNGDQHAAYRVFELKAGEAKEIYLETVKKELDELAAKLVAEADKAAAKAGNTDKPVFDLPMTRWGAYFLSNSQSSRFRDLIPS